MRFRAHLIPAVAALAAASSPVAAGPVEPPCLISSAACPPPSAGPDVIVGDLAGISRYGTSAEGISAYSIGTTSCNVGDQVLSWDADTNQHPVIAQNLYRLHEGRFEQIGMSWLKHGFAAVTGSLCCDCQSPGNSQFLGVGCSDPYSSGLNGDQDGTPGGCGGACGGLGPRYEVNPTTGEFAYPYDRIGEAGDAVDKRLQVHIEDLDPSLNVGAEYFGEGHYVTPDDAAAANHHNNVSWEEIFVSNFQNGSWILVFTGDTRRGCPAIFAWQENDPQVVIEEIEDDADPGDDHDGRFYLGYRVTDNGDGTWHYEYALYNMNSHRGIRSFTIPVPAGVTITDVGFHDVDYHSGDGVGGITTDGTDWSVQVGAGGITWTTEPWGNNVNANALKWGTLYNFRFDANTAPVDVTATMLPFRPGVVVQFTAPTLGPSLGDLCPWDLDGDEVVGITDFLELIAQWGTDPGGPPDFDGNGNVGIEDFLELLTRWGPCPAVGGCGGLDAGSCFEANPTPGCTDLDCCETVCVAQPACCDVAWDASCASLALSLCGNCGDPGAGDCCIPNGTPGCDDAACCEAVCVSDPFCCTGMWDALCAGSADGLCGCP